MATEMLMRESPGTFLLRREVKSDQFYLSYKTVNTGTIIHSKVNFTEDSFRSIEEADSPSTSIRRLVENLKTKGILTIGLKRLRKTATNSPNNSFDLNDLDTDDESSSILNIPNIPYISKEEAEKSLGKNPLGTWILRKNDKDQMRISFVSSTKGRDFKKSKSSVKLI